MRCSRLILRSISLQLTLNVLLSLSRSISSIVCTIELRSSWCPSAGGAPVRSPVTRLGRTCGTAATGPVMFGGAGGFAPCPGIRELAGLWVPLRANDAFPGAPAFGGSVLQERLNSRARLICSGVRWFSSAAASRSSSSRKPSNACIPFFAPHSASSTCPLSNTNMALSFPSAIVTISGELRTPKLVLQ